jgi:hypothetical protein
VTEKYRSLLKPYNPFVSAAPPPVVALHKVAETQPSDAP